MEELTEVVVARDAALADAEDVRRREVDHVAAGSLEPLQEAG